MMVTDKDRMYTLIENQEGEIEELKEYIECLRYRLFEEGKSDISYKHDNNKPRLDLVPPAIIEAVGIIRTYGTEKYGENTNWEKVEVERHRAAMIRHLCEYIREPSSVDSESGYPHLWHMACNIAFLCELEREVHNEHKGNRKNKKINQYIG